MAAGRWFFLWRADHALAARLDRPDLTSGEV
jgi:hypothetical protein